MSTDQKKLMWKSRQRLTHLPSPLAGGEGGVSRSTAPRRRSRPAMQRGLWEGSGERDAGMTFMIGGAWKSHDR